MLIRRDKHIIIVNEYEEFFLVCEYCWTHKSYEQNKSAVTELIGKQRKSGVRHYTPNLYINAFENDQNQTHNSKK